MAKLNVEVLDMVNGEITKIAYEGTEYAKVDDLVKSTEDILLAIENGLDRTKGEFYRVISVGSMVRWEDNMSVNGVGAEGIGDRFEVFRKISADKPTLEQRVETLESDVAALKGEKVAEETIEFEGSTYRKVEREAREGDVVIFTDETSYRYFITKNQPYKALADGKFVDDEGDRMTIYRNDSNQNRTRETVDVYELIEQAQYVPQEGDIVVVESLNKFASRGARVKVGDIGKVGEEGDKGASVRVLVPGGSTVANYVDKTEIRKATPAEVEKYEQAVKDAEITEKWAKIGRKPNEYRKGDIIEITRDQCGSKVGTVTEVVDVLGEGEAVCYKADTFCGHYGADVTAIKLVAPVESLFNANA